MARKNLLMGLNDAELPAGNSSEKSDAGQGLAPHLGVMGTRGAIGAVTRSIEQLKAQSIVELPPDLIDASFITDRLDADPDSHAELTASMSAHGQQVPIMVRPHPERDGRFQIVYGRRRLRAAAALGIQIKAVIKPLTDAQLVVAQGQENSARTDLSFIERALFAFRLEQGGFGRDIIMASLSVDKTGLSRLVSVVEKIPNPMIEAIGPAPKTGRDRWTELATRLEVPDRLANARKAMDAAGFSTKSSDDRFLAIFGATAQARTYSPRATILKASDGTRLGRFKDSAKTLAIDIDRGRAGGFADYLVEQLPSLYEGYKADSSSKKTSQ